MKKSLKIIFCFVLLITLFLSPKASAVSAPTPTKGLQQQVDELKTKIASKVAELKLVEKRGIMGTVTDSSDTHITLTDVNGNIRSVDVDEITKFSSPGSDSFGISDIKKGALLGVLGIYNKDSKRILAREISSLPPLPKIIFGGIAKVDGDNFEITVVKENGQRVVGEIEDITKTYSYVGNTLTKSGFSKLEEKQAVVVIGFPDKQDTNKILASRVLILPDVDITSRVDLAGDIPTLPPSTGSGVKLFPIKK